MSKQKSFGKVMPILAIVFFGVSLILFFAKAAVSTAYGMVIDKQSLQAIVIDQIVKTGLIAFPAVFYIIYAAAYLRKSEKKKVLLMLALVAQLLSSVALAGKVVMAYTLSHFGKAYIFMVLLALIALMSFVCLVLVGMNKSARVPMIIMAGIGVIFAAAYFAIDLVIVLSHYQFYFNNVIALILREMQDVLYSLAVVFFYCAVIFTACFKKKNGTNKVAVTIKK